VTAADHSPIAQTPADNSICVQAELTCKQEPDNAQT
jgi:hypothetical protein